MKKFTTLLILVFSLFGVFLINACTPTPLPDGESEYSTYVSYSENRLLVASNEEYNVEILFYLTETPKALDGAVSSPLKNRVKVAYIPLKLGGIDKKVVVTYLGETAELKKSAVRYELSADFECDKTSELNIMFTIDGKVENVALTDLTAGGVSSNIALSIAAEGLNATLAPEMKTGFKREISIKIIPDRLGENPYFYYVSFFQSIDKFSAVLIDPVSHKILAKKE